MRRAPGADAVRVRLTFDGQPVPKARARAKQGQRAYTPQKVTDAEDAIRWQLRAAGVRPSGGNVAVTLRFFSGDQRRVDIDNLEKLVLDACNGFAWIDDSQVVEKHTYLERGSDQPRTELAIDWLNDHSSMNH